MAIRAEHPPGSPSERDAKCVPKNRRVPSAHVPAARSPTAPRPAPPRCAFAPRRSHKALEDAKSLLRWLLQVDPLARPQSTDWVIQHEFLGGPGQPRPGQQQPVSHILAAPPQNPFHAVLPSFSLGSDSGLGLSGGDDAQQPGGRGGGAGSYISALSSLGAAVGGFLFEGAAKAREVIRGYEEGAAATTGGSAASRSGGGWGAGEGSGSATAAGGGGARKMAGQAPALRPLLAGTFTRAWGLRLDVRPLSCRRCLLRRCVRLSAADDRK